MYGVIGNLNNEMNNHTSLLNNISKYVTLSQTEIERLTSIIKTSKIKKKQYIILFWFENLLCIIKSLVACGVKGL